MAQNSPKSSPPLNRHLEAAGAGFAAINDARRSFERWLTFCCIVILLVQLTSLLVILWSLDTMYPPG